MDRWLIYPTKVLNGEIVACKRQKQACERFLRYINDPRFSFMPERAEKVIRFASKFKHYEGATANKPFIMSLYQEFMTYCIYSFYWETTGRRVCRNVWLETARKSGKTFYCACIALYEYIAFGEAAPMVQMAANSREQAKLILKMAQTLIEQVDPKHKIFKVLRNSIKCKAINGELKVLSADAGLQDGYNCSAAVLDEVHEAKDDKLYSVIQSSMAMRPNPLLMCCTTAGFNLNGFGYTMHQNAIDVLDGIVEDDSLWPFIFTIDEGDNWEDEEVWAKSNPNLGQTVSYEFLRDQVNKALSNPILRAGILTKTWNLWLSSKDTWLPQEVVVNAMDRNLRLEDFRNLNAYVGLDLSAVNDLCALSLMVPIDGKFYFWSWAFVPEETIKVSPNSEKYKYWRDTGQLIVTEGNVQDLNAILKKIMELNDIVYIQKIGYDSWGSTQLAVNATDHGLGDLLKPVSQSLGNFSRGHKMLQTIILNGTCVMEYSDVTRFCFNNIHIREDLNGNQKGAKGIDINAKIDIYIAMTECLLLYLDDPRYDVSIVY